MNAVTQVPQTRTVRGGFGLMIAAMLFLWNPHINVIDVLPDCIGWLLAALSMTQLAWAMDDVAYLRRNAWILVGITAVKLAPMAFSLIGAKTLPLLAEPTMVLTYTVCFGAFEMFLGLRVMRGWMDAISKFGLLHDSRVALYGTDREPKIEKKRTARRRRDYADGLRRLTFWFFIWRFVSSFVPELVYLRSTEYLGNVIYGVVIDIRDYRPYLIIFFSLIAGIYGLRWLIRFSRYVYRLKCDPAMQMGFAALSEERQARIVSCATIERFSIAFGCMMVGGVFLCHFTFENINILPDCIGLLFLWIAVFLLRRKTELPKAYLGMGMAGALMTVPYAVVRTWHSVVHHGFWTDNLVDYFRRTVPVSAEKQAYTMQMQLVMLVLAILETALVIWLFWRFLRVLSGLNRLNAGDGHTLYDSMTKDMMRTEREKFEKQPKKVFLWFCVSVGFEILRALPMFSFTITSIAMVRIVVNLWFLWVFGEYLSSLKKMIDYHYTYHSDADTEVRREQAHDRLK
ncbi:MAG: hypothetical protein E7604_02705 [Ruminococcaceae bacterium]|nr:hypothetical protein [Oscillospiraceae bacterium]